MRGWRKTYLLTSSMREPTPLSQLPAMRPASGFNPSENLYLVKKFFSLGADLQDVEIRVPWYMGGFPFIWRVATLPLWPLLAVCVGLVAMAFICVSTA